MAGRGLFFLKLLPIIIIMEFRDYVAILGGLVGILATKMSTFGVHRLDWLVVSKRFPWNAKYETVYGWLASFIVIYTIMNLKS
jgi:hypothetical protein